MSRPVAALLGFQALPGSSFSGFWTLTSSSSAGLQELMGWMLSLPLLLLQGILCLSYNPPKGSCQLMGSLIGTRTLTLGRLKDLSDGL